MKTLKGLVSQAVALVVKVWNKEPARVVSVVAAVIVFLGAKFGIVLPQESVLAAVGFVLPILLSGELIRTQVTPVAQIPVVPVVPVAASPVVPKV